MVKSLTRIVIKEGIKSRKLEKDGISLMDSESESEIKGRIEEAVKAILDKTEYERMDENPPTYGVEKDTV